MEWAGCVLLKEQCISRDYLQDLDYTLLCFAVLLYLAAFMLCFTFWVLIYGVGWLINFYVCLRTKPVAQQD